MNQTKPHGWRAAATGACLALGLLASGAATAAPVTVSGELTAGDPTFYRPNASGPCTVSGNLTHYDTYTIVHGGGPLVIDMRGEDSDSGTLSDPFLHLYSGSFNPAQPCQNWVAGNDDYADEESVNSHLSLTLPAGNYVIVATSFAGIEQGEGEEGGEGETEDYGLGTYQLTYNSVAPAAVPTLGEWGLMALTLLLAGGAAGALRRRQA